MAARRRGDRSAGALGRNGPSTWRGRIGATLSLFLGALLFTGLGAGGAVSLADGLRYSTRLAGTPGLLTVTGCVTTGSGKNRNTTCYGTFRADDGSRVDPSASIDDSFHRNTVLPVQEAPGEHCYRVGVAPIAGRLAGVCLCLLLALGGLAGFGGAFETAAPRLWERIAAALWVPWVRGLVARFALLAAVGTVGSGVVALIAWLIEP
ncbi:hypothetical protein ACIGXM_27820 [Kitasatospora sp. NPDC052896]|uniref:hypothetical protein n=1 Tax=Kitasatospora sp. NPDC052896 TaxID=3364061 RepID=UPI0037C9A2A5